MAKQKRIKSPGAVVLKRLLKSVQQIDSTDNKVKAGIKIQSAADFTNLKTLTKKFPEATEQAHTTTLQLLVPEIKQALTDAMNNKGYGWGYGDGDIVQTGQLRDSVDVHAGEESILVVYSATNDGYDYAAIVYFGGYIHPYGNTGVQIYMPSRPWIKHVLVGGGPVPKFPLTKRYLFHFQKTLKSLLPRGTLK